MKLGIITSFFSLALMACSASAPLPAPKGGHAETGGGPPHAHLIWCHGNPESCFEGAATFCNRADDPNDLYSVSPLGEGNGRAIRIKATGKWHQVAEAGMQFPAMVQQDDGWRMYFMCDDDHG